MGKVNTSERFYFKRTVMKSSTDLKNLSGKEQLSKPTAYLWITNHDFVLNLNIIWQRNMKSLENKCNVILW